MSKLNATEIISILWLITGLLTTGWDHWIFFGFATIAAMESIVNAFKGEE